MILIGFLLLTQTPKTMAKLQGMPYPFCLRESNSNYDMFVFYCRYSVYQPESKASWDTFSSKDVQYPASTSMLSGLTQGELYEIRISAGNSQGYSVASRPVVIYVGVAGEHRHFGLLCRLHEVERKFWVDLGV